jgi:hypothetical protein
VGGFRELKYYQERFEPTRYDRNFSVDTAYLYVAFLVVKKITLESGCVGAQVSTNLRIAGEVHNRLGRAKWTAYVLTRLKA